MLFFALFCESLDSFGSHSQQSPSPDVVNRLNSDGMFSTCSQNLVRYTSLKSLLTVLKGPRSSRFLSLIKSLTLTIFWTVTLVWHSWRTTRCTTAECPIVYVCACVRMCVLACLYASVCVIKHV